MDTVPQYIRSKIMASVPNKNTKPEILLRKLLFSLGYRFRLHQKNLPGHPDIVLPKYKTVIFVNGCFWHRHQNCKYATTPDSRNEYWLKKFNGNVKRDENNYFKLKEMGWNVIVIWTCEIKNIVTSRIIPDLPFRK